jgi:hypothetical protein
LHRKIASVIVVGAAVVGLYLTRDTFPQGSVLDFLWCAGWGAVMGLAVINWIYTVRESITETGEGA